MRRILAAVALASSLGMPPSSNLLAPLWTFLSSLGHASPTAKEVGGVDPNGLTAPAPPPASPTSDEGAGVDPSGSTGR